ncbi:DUF5518 domain-containing protein [Halorubellus sp. JP-L1]|uniref:DUF5518 domain-containing protein n=1 Tax=Halorubellus sp. JP-L1 TaxID=2715753 RepID=UPI001407D526|nr:DUF5518 domain-containing protein [Halorubellus sp. JP-L1]NHN40415.1 DUF5518 domain-containing protein [Halorubellus sp. JP-L1]
MRIDWMAVLAGIVTTIVVGAVGGAALPFTDASLPVVGAGFSGVVGGAVAGYLTGADYGNGALNGGLSTALGAILTVALLALVGLFVNPLASVGIVVFGLFFVAAAAIPGAMGGLVGAWVQGRTGERRAEEPTAR